jgi:hypothetical protein
MPRTLLACVSLCALLAGSAGAQPEPPEQPPAPAVPPEAYALVGDVAVLRTDVDAEAAAAQVPAAFVLQMRVQLEQLRLGLLSEGLDVLDEAVVRPMEVRQEVQELARQRQLSTEQLAAQVDFLEAQARVRVGIKKYLILNTPSDRVEELFEANKLAMFGEVRARAIWISAGDPPRPGNAFGLAMNLLQSMGNDPSLRAFTTLAVRHSSYPLVALTGGDLDWFDSQGRFRTGDRLYRHWWPPAVAAACFRLGEPGLVPFPVNDPQGSWVLLVTDVRIPEEVTLATHGAWAQREAHNELGQALAARWDEEFPVTRAPDAPAVPDEPQPPR